MKPSSALELVKTMSGFTCSKTRTVINVDIEEGTKKSTLTHCHEVKIQGFFGVLQDTQHPCQRTVICTTQASAWFRVQYINM